MCVTLWALPEAGGNCHEHMQDTPPHFFAVLGFAPSRSVCHGPLRQQALFHTRLALFRDISFFFWRSFWIRSLLRWFGGFRRIVGVASWRRALFNSHTRYIHMVLSFPVLSKQDLSSLSRSVSRPAVLASFTVHELPRGVRLQRLDWWRPGAAIARPLTHEEIAHTSTPCAPPPTPDAALVEDEPSSSGTKRGKALGDPSCTGGIPQCLGEVQRLCPGMCDGINHSTPYRWKRSSPQAAPHGRKTLLSPADMTRLSEHILRVTDVLCLRAATIRGLVCDWLDAEGLYVRPGCDWVRQLLRGMRLSFKKPVKCLKEQQHAHTHRLCSAGYVMLTNTFYRDFFCSCKCRIRPCICPWISRMTNELRVSVVFACSSVRRSGNDELRVCLLLFLFRSAPNGPSSQVRASYANWQDT